MATELRIARGNDAEFLVKITASGIPVNLSEVTARCEVKELPGGPLLFEAAVYPEDPANGVLRLYFPKTETAKLKPNSVIYFDLQLIFQDGQVKNVPVPPFRAIVVEPITD